MLASVLTSMLALVLALCAPRAWPQASNGSGGEVGTFAEESITIRGRVRSFRLVVPGTTLLNQPSPLVIAFHGLGDSKERMAGYTRLDKLAEEKAFILVYPNALASFWPIVPQLAGDDVALFDSLRASIAARYNVDLARVYLIGNSNGAYFAHLVAAHRSEQVAAVAGHSGGIGVVARLGAQIRSKYAVMLVHGDQDRVVPVGESRHARDVYTQWGHTVEYVEIPGLAHLWANHVSINERIWEFLRKHAIAVEGRR